MQATTKFCVAVVVLFGLFEYSANCNRAVCHAQGTAQNDKKGQKQPTDQQARAALISLVEGDLKKQLALFALADYSMFDVLMSEKALAKLKNDKIEFCENDRRRKYGFAGDWVLIRSTCRFTTGVLWKGENWVLSGRFEMTRRGQWCAVLEKMAIFCIKGN